MSIVGVEQTIGGVRACAVCIAAEKSRKEEMIRTLMGITQKRNGWFITIPLLTQKSGPDFQPKARQVVRQRPSKASSAGRMISGRVPQRTQDFVHHGKS